MHSHSLFALSSLYHLLFLFSLSLCPFPHLCLTNIIRKHNLYHQMGCLLFPLEIILRIYLSYPVVEEDLRDIQKHTDIMHHE